MYEQEDHRTGNQDEDRPKYWKERKWKREQTVAGSVGSKT